jgi:hypothetical protein
VLEPFVTICKSLPTDGASMGFFVMRPFPPLIQRLNWIVNGCIFRLLL